MLQTYWAVDGLSINRSNFIYAFGWSLCTYCSLPKSRRPNSLKVEKNTQVWGSIECPNESWRLYSKNNNYFEVLWEYMKSWASIDCLNYERPCCLQERNVQYQRSLMKLFNYQGFKKFLLFWPGSGNIFSRNALTLRPVYAIAWISSHDVLITLTRQHAWICFYWAP